MVDFVGGRKKRIGKGKGKSMADSSNGQGNGQAESKPVYISFPGMYVSDKNVVAAHQVLTYILKAPLTVDQAIAVVDRFISLAEIDALKDVAR